MMQRWIVVVSLAVLMSFAVACNYEEGKGKGIGQLNLNDFEINEADKDWTIGELVKDSTWTVENISAKPIYPKFDNQITFIGDDTIQLDWGAIAAICTGRTEYIIGPITCKLFSGGGSGLVLYLEFERSGTLVCSTVHILVDSVNEMTWVGYENISILRRVGEYCEEDDDDDDDGKDKKKD